MPLLFLGLGAAFVGAKFDDWIENLTGEKKPEVAGGWTPTKVAFAASAAVFVALGVKKILS